MQEERSDLQTITGPDFFVLFSILGLTFFSVTIDNLKIHLISMNLEIQEVMYISTDKVIILSKIIPIIIAETE